MNSLALPEQIDGPWENLLILTFGADLPFFENTLLPLSKLRRACTNKVILLDGHQYLDSCEHLRHSGLVRHLNQRYVAEGIWGARNAHGKLVLLTNPRQGRLLVGSGNLGHQGYASGGELFTLYRYSEESRDDLDAFLDVYELTTQLRDLGYVSGYAVKRLNRIWEDTPWIYGHHGARRRHIRHNLETSFLDQLRQEVGTASVEELTVMAPFHDERLRALTALIEAFQPQLTTVLVQPTACSVDPQALTEIVDRSAGRCRVLACQKTEGRPYLHAKLLLLKLQDRTICLQGSPNCSQAALQMTPPKGNLEIANLISGPRGSFDHLMQPLSLEAVSLLESLDLSYKPPTPTTEAEAEQWQLVGGEWEGDRLILRYRGTPPSKPGLTALIGDLSVPLGETDQLGRALVFHITPAAQGLLGHVAPVRVQWSDDDSLVTSNSVYVCNVGALEAELEIGEPTDLQGIGQLDLDDRELAQLLADLDASIPIDKRSIWHLARRSRPQSRDDEAGLQISYADIDYGMLRRHPRIQQYYASPGAATSYGRSRLQIILGAIADHFRKLTSAGAATQLATDATGLMASLVDVDSDEADGQEETAPRRHWSESKRARGILKRFIRRYLRGLQDPQFHELVGYAVVSQNYVIFTHILWHLLVKKWLEPSFVIDALLKTAGFFWGDGKTSGYFSSLDPGQQAHALAWIREGHADVYLLVSLYHGATATESQDLELRPRLRDFWRAYLQNQLTGTTMPVLEEAWHIALYLMPYDPPRPTEIVARLATLAWAVPQSEVLNALEADLRYPRMTCDFDDTQRVHGVAGPVRCLRIKVPDALADRDQAVAALNVWMRMERLDYYRISQPDDGSLILYDATKGICLFRDRAGSVQEIAHFEPLQHLWEEQLSRLAEVAADLEQRLTLVEQHGIGIEARNLTQASHYQDADASTGGLKS